MNVVNLLQLFAYSLFGYSSFNLNDTNGNFFRNIKVMHIFINLLIKNDLIIIYNLHNIEINKKNFVNYLIINKILIKLIIPEINTNKNLHENENITYKILKKIYLNDENIILNTLYIPYNNEIVFKIKLKKIIFKFNKKLIFTENIYIVLLYNYIDNDLYTISNKLCIDDEYIKFTNYLDIKNLIYDIGNLLFNLHINHYANCNININNIFVNMSIMNYTKYFIIDYSYRKKYFKIKDIPINNNYLYSLPIFGDFTSKFTFDESICLELTNDTKINELSKKNWHDFFSKYYKINEFDNYESIINEYLRENNYFNIPPINGKVINWQTYLLIKSDEYAFSIVLNILKELFIYDTFEYNLIIKIIQNLLEVKPYFILYNKNLKIISIKKILNKNSKYYS